MNGIPQESAEVPVWAREDAFPEAPPGWGWADVKGNRHPCDSEESLLSAIRDDHAGSLDLVWLPGHSRMILPEELPGVGDSLRKARDRWTRDDLAGATYRLYWCGVMLAGFVVYLFYSGLIFANRLAERSGSDVELPQRLLFAARSVLSSGLLGLAALMFIIFAFIPWYQARKRRAELDRWTEEGIAESAPGIRFETWLAMQRAPLTRVFLVLVTVVALAQILSEVKTRGWGTLFALFHHWDGTAAAGLIKDRYFQGEWWRLITAPFLHGNVVHYAMNAAALACLGKRMEVFARWPHLPLVFLFAACVGGEASARLLAAPSVGASGGLLGWLGFLLVFETLHRSLVPRSARRRLIAGVLLTGLIGLIGFRYIDNAAHAGGLLAGMLYAAVVFPKSTATSRPRSNWTDRIVGGISFGILVAAVAFAVFQVLRA